MQQSGYGASIVVFLVDIARYDRYPEDLVTHEMTGAMTMFELVANSPMCSCAYPVVWFSNSRLYRSKAERCLVEGSFPDSTGGPNFEKAVEYFTSRFRGLYRGVKDFSARSSEPEDDRLVRQLLSLANDVVIQEHLKALLADI